MTGTLSTGWADVEASILADWAAGFTVRQIAARCGWWRKSVSRVLTKHGIDPFSRGPGGSIVPRWTDTELAAIAGAADSGDAWRRYCVALPADDERRTRRAVTARWRRMTGRAR